VLYDDTPKRTNVLTPEESWLMVDMLKDVVRRGTAASVWASGFHVPAGGKTGTTNDGTDVWFIGFTPDLVAGVWMGFDRPQKIMSNAQGGRLAAPAWLSFMTEAYRRRPTPPDWPRPDDLLALDIDRTTAMLRNPFCPDSVVVTEYFIPGTEPTQECNVHNAFNTGPRADSLRPPSVFPPPPALQPPRPKRDSARVPDPFHIPESHKPPR